MSARLILVTGGCRSGKSAFAQRLVEGLAGERLFLATCPVLDAEMAERVLRHREARAGRGWITVEEELDPAGAVAAAPGEAAILLDCLTLWVGNVMHHAETNAKANAEANVGGAEKNGANWPGEDDMARRAGDLAAAARARSGVFVAVTNEVGLGIVPGNAAARRFRDLAGRVNQTMAALADEVYFMVCGIAQRIK